MPFLSHQTLAIRLVTYGVQPSLYEVTWRVTADIDGRPVQLGFGKISSDLVSDWGLFELPLHEHLDLVVDQLELQLSYDGGIEPESPIGVPLFKPTPGNRSPGAIVNGEIESTGAQVGLVISYSL